MVRPCNFTVDSLQRLRRSITPFGKFVQFLNVRPFVERGNQGCEEGKSLSGKTVLHVVENGSHGPFHVCCFVLQRGFEAANEHVDFTIGDCGMELTHQGKRELEPEDAG